MQISAGTKSGTLEYLLGHYSKKGPLRLLSGFNTIFGRQPTPQEIACLDDRPGVWENPAARVWKKPGKVLVVNASPRRDVGFTYRFVKPFVEGMRSAGVHPEIVQLYDPAIKVEACLGCEACWNRGDGQCILNDDGNDLVARVVQAELIVFAFPLYIDTVPAKLKALLDRCFSNVRPVFVESADGVTRHPLFDKRDRYMAMLSVCGFPEMRHFEPVVATFKDIARNFHTPLIASVLRPGSQFLNLNPMMVVERQKVFAALSQAGRGLVEHGGIHRKVQKTISDTGAMPLKSWRLYSNLYWHLKGKKK
jgi:multimeric flavodoxin WrbA